MCTVLVQNTGYQQSDTLQSPDVQTALDKTPEINRRDISADCWSSDTLQYPPTPVPDLKTALNEIF